MAALNKITLTEEQQKFVRENYKTMTGSEMGRRLEVNQATISGNMKLMNLSNPINQKRQNVEIDIDIENGWFDEKVYNKIYSY